MEYLYKGEFVRKIFKLFILICILFGLLIFLFVLLGVVCDNVCYNRNSYVGKCMKRIRLFFEFVY